MRDRQLCAVTLAAASVPALLYLPRLGWVWATAAAAISALLLGLCGRRCAPGGLTEVIPAAFGRAGKAVHALVLLGGALLLGGAARALCAAGTLSPRVAGEEAFAVYTMAKSVSVFGVMERLEPVVSAALTAGGFCLLSVLCLANAKTAQAIGWKRRTGIGNFLLGCTGYLAGTVLPEGVQALAAAICWGMVPLVTLWVASVKKLQKNQKNA